VDRRQQITGKTIYHFGTGTHHIVGLTQAANGSDNVVFGITASIVEYEAYIKLANERPQLLKSYLAYFATFISPMRGSAVREL